MMIGGGMSNGNIHSHMDVPIALVGGAGGHQGQPPRGDADGHAVVQSARAVSSNRAGVPIESFGDSTGVLDLDAVADEPSDVPPSA